MFRVLTLAVCLFLGSVGISYASCNIQAHSTTGTLADGFYSVTFSDINIGTVVIDFSVLVNGSNLEKADDLRKRIQAFFQEKFQFESLPSGDPNRNIIVPTPNNFYGTIDGVKEEDLDTSLAPEDKYYYSRGCEVFVEVVGSGKNAGVSVTLASTT